MISIDDIRIRRELPGVLSSFGTWCTQENLGLPEELLRSSMTNFLRRYAAVNGDRKLRVLGLYPFATAMDDFMFSMKPGDFRDMAGVIDAYLRFLSTTGTWGGTAEDYRRTRSYFDRLMLPAPGPRYSGIPELQSALIRVPVLTGSQAASAIEQLEITSRMRSFLTWLGNKREITSTRALPRKHVQAAAASLDVLAVDVVDGSGAALVPGTGPETGPVFFRNASHVPRLKLYWDALVGAEFIRLTPTRAYPTERCGKFLAGGHADATAGVRTVARHMYKSVAEESGGRDVVPELGYLTRYFLLEAGVEPLSVEILRHPVRGLDDVDPRGHPPAIEAAWRRLESLRDEGLVSIGNMLSIPEVLLEPLVLELAEPSGVSYEFAGPGDRDDTPT
ncbi:hypothetical protein ACSYDW_15825 [Paeniglutamicibacter sp. R2-26]|uniref:hypothetical protein n=1 Tax=Paeniglutamicibacter sp. R2-26 TaxID=3144417 RepID=UPI003EE63B4C